MQPSIGRDSPDVSMEESAQITFVSQTDSRVEVKLVCNLEQTHESN